MKNIISYFWTTVLGSLSPRATSAALKRCDKIHATHKTHLKCVPFKCMSMICVFTHTRIEMTKMSIAAIDAIKTLTSKIFLLNINSDLSATSIRPFVSPSFVCWLFNLLNGASSIYDFDEEQQQHHQLNDTYLFKRTAWMQGTIYGLWHLVNSA